MPVATLLPLLSWGCHASVSAKSQVGVEEKKDVVGFDEPLADAGDGAPDAAGSLPVAGAALLGARHDVRLAEGFEGKRCRCLSLAVGRPDDSGFAWQSEPPVIDPATEVVIAFTSASQDCAGEPEGSLGASYWGYRSEGADVIVVIEAARFGRPSTAGAIIPRPATGGRVLVAPVDDSVPYGRPLSGEGDRCVVMSW